MSDIRMTAIARTDQVQRARRGDIEAQIGQLRQDLSSLTATFAAIGARRVERTRREVARTSQKTFAAVGSEVSALESKVASGIRDNHAQAVAIAAGIGFVASFLTRR